MHLESVQPLDVALNQSLAAHDEPVNNFIPGAVNHASEFVNITPNSLRAVQGPVAFLEGEEGHCILHAVKPIVPRENLQHFGASESVVGNLPGDFAGEQ